MTNKYTISIFTENIVGLLLRITAIFTRRHINIESLTVSETEKIGISRFTIVVNVSEDMVAKVVKQIRKIIEVIHTEYHMDVDLIHSQMALFKLDLEDPKRVHAVKALAAQSNARILVDMGKHIILEKTGNRDSLESFLRSLEAFGETEYVRTGRIALTTVGSMLKDILPKLPDINSYPGYSMAHHEKKQ